MYSTEVALKAIILAPKQSSREIKGVEIIMRWKCLWVIEIPWIKVVMNECESYESGWIFNIVLLPGVLSPFLLAYPQGGHIQLYGLCTADHTGHSVNTCPDPHAPPLGGLSGSPQSSGPTPFNRCSKMLPVVSLTLLSCETMPPRMILTRNPKDLRWAVKSESRRGLWPHKWKSVPSMMLSHLLKTARVPEPTGTQHCHREPKMNIRLPWAVWLSG